jgi:hypothetical protein
VLSCVRLWGRFDRTKAPSEPTGDCTEEDLMKPNSAAPDTVFAAASAAFVACCFAWSTARLLLVLLNLPASSHRR